MPVRQKGEKWVADFAHEKRRYREFGFSSQVEAEAWEKQARVAVTRGLPLPPSPRTQQALPPTSDLHVIQGLVEHVKKVRWSSMKSDASEKTATAFQNWVGARTPTSHALTTEEVHRYVAHLKDGDRAGGTINRHLAAISCLSKIAKKLRIIEEIPDLPKQREGDHRIRWFTEEEESMLFNTLRLWSKHRERDLFIFLVDTGARLGEALKLRWQDVSPDGRIVTFWDTKAGNSRSIPLTIRAGEAVKRRRAEGGELAGPFAWAGQSSLTSQWRRLQTHLPFLQDAVIHTFRHTCASRLVQRGVDIMRVRMWMGHKAVETSLRYAHLAPKHLDDALKVLEGGTR